MAKAPKISEPAIIESPEEPEAPVSGGNKIIETPALNIATPAPEAPEVPVEPNERTLLEMQVGAATLAKWHSEASSGSE